MMLDTSSNTLTDDERTFIASMGTQDKPMTLPEFAEYWLSLNEGEKRELRMMFWAINIDRL